MVKKQPEQSKTSISKHVNMAGIDSPILNKSDLEIQNDKRAHNKSLMEEVNNLSSKIKILSVPHLTNQTVKQAVEFDRNLHLNRDTSNDNPFKRATKRKKKATLRHFTHSLL